MSALPHQTPQHELLPYRVYVIVWLALVGFTALTVGVSFVDMKHVVVLTALIIASVKASLVLLYFMHIRYEKPLFRYMILAVIVTYCVFMIITFSDYSFRD